MRTKNFGMYLCVVLLGLLLSPAAPAEDTAPGFVLPTGSGTVNLADFKGKVVYLDFWASWCPPCRKSFPWMNEMAQRYGRQGLTVVAVNVDKTRDLAKKFLSDVPANFTVAYDADGKVADTYKVMGMPSSYLIDRTGRIQSVHIGFRDGDAEQLEAALQTLLLVR